MKMEQKIKNYRNCKTNLDRAYNLLINLRNKFSLSDQDKNLFKEDIKNLEDLHLELDFSEEFIERKIAFGDVENWLHRSELVLKTCENLTKRRKKILNK